ncbi:MAG: hypothetical protein IJW55_01075 [Clostridia bacterium]|nr:hypothetical protein [Clostridia bacterium]
MKKRLFCLFLCLITLLTSVLVSCSSKDDETATEDISDAASESAMTLSMWIVSKDKISAAAAAAVSEQINSVTKSKFKTQLVINYLTEDEYESKLEQTITAYEASKANTPVVPEEAETETSAETGAVTDETETNEWGLTVIKYPELIANQVDIIYISGEDMYIDFIGNEWLSELDTELSSSSKKIKEYVSSTLLSAAKYNGTTYAIPNNLVIGEYTYMLLNKDLMKKYQQHAYAEEGMINGFYNENLYSFLNLVYLFEDNVIPVDASYEDCLDLLAHYWSIDSETYDLLDEFSVFGYHYNSIDELNRGSTILGYNSLFEDEEFVEDYLKLNEFRFKDYFNMGKDAEGNSLETRTGGAAVKFINGDSNILSKGVYKDENGVEYYPIVVGYPTASSDDIYGNMFGVCKYTRSVSRSMEIITYLNTNADFRNLLQYGVEGTHYKVEEAEDGTKTVNRLNNDYLMDIYATGNAFLAYPDPLYKMSADIWESGKVQNRDSLVDPLLGLHIGEYAESAGSEEESVTLAKVGYNISYSSGHSKDVLGQNATLKKWLDECDAAGKGIYVLNTSVTEGQYLTATYYIYNNNLTKNTNFSVVDNRVVEKKVDESTQKETEVQTDLDFVFTYTDASGNSSTGYELSVFHLYTKKSNEFELKANVNETETALQMKDLGSLLNFDFYNTNEYSIEVYEKLSKSAVLKNETLASWLDSCDENAKNATGSNPMSFLMTDKKDLGNGKTEYTFVAYRTKLKNITELQILPTGGTGKLDLRFNYSHGEDKLDSTEANYLLYYVRVTANSNVDVKASYFSNGSTVTIAEEKQDTPNFEMCGNLDTELVKFLETLNDNIAGENGVLEEKFQEYYSDYKDAVKSIDNQIAAINGKQDLTDADLADIETLEKEKETALNGAIGNFEALVAELGVLLSTGEDVPMSTSFTVLSDYITAWNYVTEDRYTASSGDVNLAQFHRYIQMAANYETQTIMVEDGEGGESEALYQETEAYVYFDSPYAVYYAWMQTYGYLPSTKK